jgi:hypothetical protein
MSFNCRGIIGLLKIPTLKRVVSCEHPDVFLLQETLGEGEEVKYFLESFLSGWKFITLDVKGGSRGLTMGWNSQTVKATNCWGLESGLGLTLIVLGSGEVFKIFNIYGPYQDRVPF